MTAGVEQSAEAGHHETCRHCWHRPAGKSCAAFSSMSHEARQRQDQRPETARHVRKAREQAIAPTDRDSEHGVQQDVYQSHGEVTQVDCGADRPPGVDDRPEAFRTEGELHFEDVGMQATDDPAQVDLRNQRRQSEDQRPASNTFCPCCSVRSMKDIDTFMLCAVAHSRTRNLARHFRPDRPCQPDGAWRRQRIVAESVRDADRPAASVVSLPR